MTRCTDRCCRGRLPADREIGGIEAPEPVSWWLIGAAAVMAGAVIFFTWNGSLFG